MAINLPQKPRPGFHAIQELTRAVNGLIDYISTFSIIGKKPIRVTRKMFQTEISLDEYYVPSGGESSSDEESSSEYNGPFKVVLQDNTLSVICGYDKSNSIAGYAYYNIKVVTCWKTSYITPQTGYLCLKIRGDSTAWNTYHYVSYDFESTIPDMPTLSNNNGDNTVKYPLAEIRNENGQWKVHQLCYGFPQLWCFAPCDDDSSGSGGGGGDYDSSEPPSSSSSSSSSSEPPSSSEPEPSSSYSSYSSYSSHSSGSSSTSEPSPEPSSEPSPESSSEPSPESSSEPSPEPSSEPSSTPEPSPEPSSTPPSVPPSSGVTAIDTNRAYNGHFASIPNYSTIKMVGNGYHLDLGYRPIDNNYGNASSFNNIVDYGTNNIIRVWKNTTINSITLNSTTTLYIDDGVTINNIDNSAGGTIIYME